MSVIILSVLLVILVVLTVLNNVILTVKLVLWMELVIVV